MAMAQQKLQSGGDGWDEAAEKWGYSGFNRSDDADLHVMVNTADIVDLYGINLVNQCHGNLRPFLERLKRMGIDEVRVTSGSVDISKSGKPTFHESYRIDGSVLFVALSISLNKELLEKNIKGSEAKKREQDAERQTVRDDTGRQALKALYAEAGNNGAAAPLRVMHVENGSERDPVTAYRGAREAIVRDIVEKRFPDFDVVFTDQSTVLFNIMNDRTFVGLSGHISLRPPFSVVINRVERVEGKWRKGNVVFRKEGITDIRPTA